MAKTALLIGGTGQIGWASAENLLEHGWDVTIASRAGAAGPAGARTITLDREDTGQLVAGAEGADLVLDAVAFTPAHGAQLAQLAGRVGSLVVVSTASVYLGDNGTYLDIATGPDDFPAYPEPVTEQQPTIDNDEATYSPLKAAMERVLLGTQDLPVSILRPGAIHGPNSKYVREWFFVKRALDRRQHAVLAYDGTSRFGTSATANIAELVRLCGEQPGMRTLNAEDPVVPTVREIGETVFGILGHRCKIVGMPGAPRGELGTSPWAVPSPFIESMAFAEQELGYRPVVTYEEGVRSAIEWLVDEATAANWRERFPRMVERYGADEWFPYDEEDAYIASLA